MAQILDLGKIRFQFKGEWSAATEYQFNDVVSYKGNSYVYISTAKTTGTLTSNSQFWGRMTNGFDFTGTWSSGTTYGYGSVVRYGGDLFIYTNAVASAGNLPTNATYWTMFMYGWSFQGEWSSSTAYKIGETVTYGGIAYVAVQDSTNQNPDSNTAYWSTITQGFQSEGAYNAATAYQKNDLVSYGGNTYIAKTNTTGNLPTNGTYWNLFATGWSFKGVWSSATAYKIGEFVSYGGNTYVATADSTNQVPSTATGFWTLLVGGYAPLGAYSAATAYKVGQTVTYNGSSYVCILDTTAGTLPSNSTYWTVIAAGTTGSVPAQTTGTVNLSSVDATLSTGSDASGFANLVRITAGREFASLNLPDATAASTITTKYKISNETAFAVALRDNTGALLTSIQPYGFADVALMAAGTQAGVWHVTGKDLLPVFVKNSVIIPNANATATNNSAGGNPFFTVRLDSKKVFTAVTVATATTINCFVTDYSTTPATVSATPLVQTVDISTITAVYAVSASRVVVFTSTGIYLFGVSNTTVSLIAASPSNFTNVVRTGVMGVLAVQQLQSDLFAVVFGGAAATQSTVYAYHIYNDGIYTASTLSTNTNGVVNGWDMAVTSATTLVVTAGVGVSPTNLWVEKFSITKNNGSNPTVSTVSSITTSDAAWNPSGYSINIIPDSSNKDLCLVTGLDTATATAPKAVAVTGCTGAGALTIGTPVQIEANAMTAYNANQFGQTFTRRNVRSVSAGKFHWIYQGLNNYLRVVKINVSGTTITTKVSNYVPKAAASAIQSILPLFTTATESAFAVYHGQVGQSYSGVVGYTEDASEFVNFKSFNAPVGDHLSQVVGSSVLCTSDGWVLVQVAQPASATAANVLNSVYAVFRCYAGGQVKYFGQVALPFNSGIGALWNPQFIEAGQIVHSHVGNDYDYTQAIPYRRSTFVEFAKV